MLNKVCLLGNLGADPEIKSTNDGREFANFSLATSESWNDKQTGEKKEKTEWHRVVCFSEGLTKVLKNYVKKGSKLYIEGQLQTRKWQDESGSDRYSTEVVMQGFNCKLLMLDNKGSSDNSSVAETVTVDAHTEAKGNGFQPQPEDDSEPWK